MQAFLLAGPELFLKEETLDKIKESVLSKRNQEFNYNIFYGESANKDIKDALNTPTFLGDAKLIVIKNAERLSSLQKQHVLTYIANPLHDTCLVLETIRDDLRDSFLSNLSKHTKVVECKKLYGVKLYSWVHKRLAGYKKKMFKQAVDLLIELKGNDLRRLATELDKLILYTDSRYQITKQDVENLVGRDLTYDVFDLIDAISHRDFQKSLFLTSLFIANRKRESEVIGLLGWQLKRMWKANELRNNKVLNSNIARTLKIPPRYTEKFFKQLSHFGINDIKKALKILLEADRDIKRGRNSSLILELLIIRLCSA